MATLSLPGLTVGLPIWLFSTCLVPNVLPTGQSVPPREQYHVDSKVGLSPSSPVSTSSSSTSSGECLDSSNQVAKKNKKKTKKKKSHKREVKSKTQVRPPSAPPRKVKFPCKLCKDDHLLRDCPGIPRILKVWSHNPAHPSFSSKAHGDATPSTDNIQEKGKIRIPCRLCEGNHPLHLFTLMDKASLSWKVLQLHHPNFPLVIRGSL